MVDTDAGEYDAAVIFGKKDGAGKWTADWKPADGIPLTFSNVALKSTTSLRRSERVSDVRSSGMTFLRHPAPIPCLRMILSDLPSPAEASI